MVDVKVVQSELTWCLEGQVSLNGILIALIGSQVLGSVAVGILELGQWR